MAEWAERRTVLSVGSTGTGKSLYGNVVFNVDSRSSSNARSETREATFYLSHDGLYQYIDTPGFLDSEGMIDEDVFNSIIREMHNRADENRTFRIDAILWFCLPNDRADRLLQRQASFIQKFTERSNPLNRRNIWRSVLIVFKGRDNYTGGPQFAAREAAETDDLQFNIFRSHILGIRDDDNEDDEELRGRHFYTQEEVRRAVRERISTFPGIEVIFENKRCLKCNKRGNPSFIDFIDANNMCHPLVGHDLSKIRRYYHISVNTYHVHVGEIISVHPWTRYLSGAELGGKKHGVFGFIGGLFSGGAEVCGQCGIEIGRSEGCEIRCNCCNRSPSETGCKRIYECCKESGEGCVSYIEEVCKNKCFLSGKPCVCTECMRRVGTEGCERNIAHEWVD